MSYLIARIAFVLLLLIVLFGVLLVLIGGQEEKQGQVRDGARRARLGGFISAAAACMCVAVGPAVLAFLPDSLRTWLFETGGSNPALAVTSALGLTVLAGFLAGLAGLAGKPRPTGWFAAVSLITALVLFSWVVFSAPPA